MKKLSSLLKKVDFFEKLAIHGSRRNALKALAEDPMIKVKRLINESFIKLQELLNLPEMHELKDTVIMPNIQSGMLDPSELTKFVADISDTAKEIKQKMIDTGISPEKAAGIILYVENQMYEAAQELKSMNDDLSGLTSYVSFNNIPRSTPMKSLQYPSIDPSLQKKLREFAITKGLTFFGMDSLKKTEDGKLGPMTRDIIEKIKDYFNNKPGLTSVGKITAGPSGDQYLFSIIDKELAKFNEPSEESGGIAEIKKLYPDEPYMPDEI